jgi:hypothetical protein
MSDFNFERKDTLTIMDGMVVRYQSGEGYFEVSASRNGVHVFNLPRITTEQELERAVNIIKRAYLQHCQLLKNGSTFSEEEVSARMI